MSVNPLFDDARKLRLLEWLVTAPSERSPATKQGLADELGVAPRTLREWQARDDFHREWEKRAKEVAGDPERTQRVLDSLFRAATDPEARDRVQASKAYLEAVGAIKPPAVVERSVSTVAGLSDAELHALIAQKAGEALDARGSGLRAVK